MSLPAAIDSVLAPAGPNAARIAEISWVLIGGAGVVFCIVLLILGLALRQRRSPDAAQPTATVSRWWIVGGGIAFPLIVMAALLAYETARTAPSGTLRDRDAMVITVRAHLWWWEVRYRDPQTGADIVLANEIRLPVGRPLTVGLVSQDVIHSLWVPALGGKVDMVPGRVNQLSLHADRPGVFRGQCAEFCGEQHARMALQVVAQPEAAFDSWLAGQARSATEPADATARRGLQVFSEQRCQACHPVRGLFVDGIGVGPDLTHLASRRTLGAGILPLTPAALAGWVHDVQQHKPGARMPSYQHIDASSRQALVSFLMQLE